jgi:hypothetical protein
VLAFGGPRYRVVAEEDGVAGGGATSIDASCPICIHVGDQGVGDGR